MQTPSTPGKPKQNKRINRVSAFVAAPSTTHVIEDMRQFQKEVTRTPAEALAFLKRAGLVSASGKPKQLIHD